MFKKIKFVTALIIISFTIPIGVTNIMAQETQVNNSSPAYFIAEFWLEDAEAIKPYSENVPETLAAFGGEFLVRGGQMEELEGDTPHNARMIVIRFDSMEQAQAWYRSDVYQKLIPLRQKSGKTNVYIVDGLPQ